MSHPVYVETKTLPDTLQSALASAGHSRPIVPVYVSETSSMSSASGDGMRGFTVLVDIDTGRSEAHVGSWGGSNPFQSSPVDGDTRSRPLPPNGAVIHGHSGGGKPTYASITIHPSRAAKLLPASNGGDLSPRLKTLLMVYRGYNSRGRAEWFERHGTGTEAEISELAKRGLIKVNKAGSVTVTADGRNTIKPSDDIGLYKGWPQEDVSPIGWDKVG